MGPKLRIKITEGRQMTFRGLFHHMKIKQPQVHFIIKIFDRK